VTNAQDEAVPTNPIWVCWIMPEHFLEQKMRYWGQRNSGAWMTVSNFFNRVGCQNPCRINGFSV
jgi:hypothetical protein